MRIPWLSVLVLALVPIGFSCKTTLTDFTCSVNADCTSSGTPGFCEASGSCSYADVDCPNGRRYGSASGELSNQCVGVTLDGGLDGLDGGRSAALSGLVLSSSSALDPPFSPSHFSYTLDVSLLESELRITPSTVNPDAEIQVDELAVASGSVSGPIALDLGATLIHVDVMTSFGTQRYSVSVERGSKMIGQIAYGKASNTGNKDQFGRTLAISGDTLVVGAAGEDSSVTGVDGDQNNDDAKFSGAVYVFRRTGASWAQEAYLKASNAEERDLFGHSVAIQGDTLAVGAFAEESAARGVNGNQEDNDAPDSGAVYVFARSGSTWTQEAYLKASNTESYDKFGASLALSGDTLVVSAEGEASSATGVNGDQTDNMMFGSGAVYVFRRVAGGWAQEAYVKASNPASFDYFGISIDIEGDTMVVGAHAEDSSATGVNGVQNDDSADGSGAVYVFGRSGTTWVQEA